MTFPGFGGGGWDPSMMSRLAGAMGGGAAPGGGFGMPSFGGGFQPGGIMGGAGGGGFHLPSFGGGGLGAMGGGGLGQMFGGQGGLGGLAGRFGGGGFQPGGIMGGAGGAGFSLPGLGGPAGRFGGTTTGSPPANPMQGIAPGWGQQFAQMMGGAPQGIAAGEPTGGYGMNNAGAAAAINRMAGQNNAAAAQSGYGMNNAGAAQVINGMAAANNARARGNADGLQHDERIFTAPGLTTDQRQMQLNGLKNQQASNHAASAARSGASAVSPYQNQRLLNNTGLQGFAGNTGGSQAPAATSQQARQFQDSYNQQQTANQANAQRNAQMQNATNAQQQRNAQTQAQNAQTSQNVANNQTRNTNAQSAAASNQLANNAARSANTAAEQQRKKQQSYY